MISKVSFLNANTRNVQNKPVNYAEKKDATVQSSEGGKKSGIGIGTVVGVVAWALAIVMSFEYFRRG